MRSMISGRQYLLPEELNILSAGERGNAKRFAKPRHAPLLDRFTCRVPAWRRWAIIPVLPPFALNAFEAVKQLLGETTWTGPVIGRFVTGVVGLPVAWLMLQAWQRIQVDEQGLEQRSVLGTEGIGWEQSPRFRRSGRRSDLLREAGSIEYRNASRKSRSRVVDPTAENGARLPMLLRKRFPFVPTGFPTK